jgi:lipoprotein-anchoring transpeptidase ErfK/SrfK
MRRRPLLIVLSILLVFVILLTSAGVAFAYVYRGKAYPNVTVAGIKAHALSKDDLHKALSEKVAAYSAHPVIVTLPDITKPRIEETGDYPQIEVSTTAAELGLQFNQDQAEDQVWGVGHTRSLKDWVVSTARSLFGSTVVPLTYSVDPSKIDAFINTQVAPQIVTPTSATIKIDGATISIDDAKPGLSVDTTELSKRLAVALPTAIEQDTLYLKAPVSIQDAGVTRTSLQPVVNQLTSLGDLHLDIKNDTVTLRPTKADLLAWFSLVQDDKGAVTIAINNTAVADYLKKKGGTKVDIDASLKTVTETVGKSIAEVATLSEAKSLGSRTVALTLKPEPKPTEIQPGNYTLGRFEGKYVEVNLAEQKLYRITGNNLEKVYRVSTGKWSTPTPKGDNFTITSKILRAYSRTYGLYMPYWMNFTGADINGEELPVGSFGLHELPEWPSGYKEGASHIGTPVSHGCVRLGVGDAAEIYAWADVGTHVVIH